MPFVKKCPFLRHKIEEDVRVLDYRHSGLLDLPSEVFDKERTLEELYADCNQIRDLPRELFYCQGLRKLSISDNEITSLPPAISSLTNLEELDFSKNGIIEVPDSIKSCKYLRSVDASVNPLGKLPEGFTHLPNLTHLYLNDTFLDFLPGSFGRMVTLKILELRENHLKTLPRSFSRLIHLERLDIGNNELTELSDVIGGLTGLLELWCDNNQITTIANNIGNLKQLMFLDASNNQLQELPPEIEGCTSLADLHLTSNNMVTLPASVGNLINLTTLKVDNNQLTCLPPTLGALSSLSEFNVSNNNLQELPASIGLLRNLRTFYADENMLQQIPAEIGSCSGITVLSLRSNKLTYIPDELGRIPGLRVLNLSDNLLHYLPFSIVKLKELQALWLTENQTRPLIPLQSEYDAETGRKILTCYLLPQGHMKENDKRELVGDNESFHGSMWDEERLRRQQIHFDFIDGSDEGGTLFRCPTPYPKEMRDKVRHAHNLALRQKINVGQGETEVDSLSGRMHQRNLATGNFEQAGAENLDYSKFLEHSERQIREARITKPTSPRHTETHRLYRFDKEKLWKDKVRMQHRLSAPDCGSNISVFLTESKHKHKKSGGMNLSGSVPDLAATGGDAEAGLASSPIPVYSDLYGRQLTSRHRGRRSRLIREYDSDTGYRSDGEIIRVPIQARDLFNMEASSERLSAWSQPLPHRSLQQYRGRGRQGLRIASDVEGYAGGSTFPTANAAAAAFQRQLQSSFPSHGTSQNLHRSPQSPVITGASSVNSPTPSKPEVHHYDSVSLTSQTGMILPAQFGLTSASHPGTSLTLPPNRTMKSQPDRTLTSRQGETSRINDRFQASVSSNSSRSSNTRLGSIVCNDQLYSQTSITKHLDSSSTKSSSSSSNDRSFVTHLSSSQPETGKTPIKTVRTLTDSQVTSATHAEALTNLPHKQITVRLQSPHSRGQANFPPSANNSNVRDKLAIHHNTHAASASIDSPFLEPNFRFSQEKHAATGLTAGSHSGHDNRTSQVYTSLEQATAAYHSTTNNEAPQHAQSLTSPPPYISTPPYRRSDSRNPGAQTHRPSNDSSSSRVISPHNIPYMSSSIGDAASANHGSRIPNLNLNQAHAATCGFHGNSPFPSLPGPARQNQNSPHSIGQGDGHDFGQTQSGILFKDNETSRSGSSSSQLASASQLGQTQDLRLAETQLQRTNQSNRSDSHSDLHNLTFSRDSPHLGVFPAGSAHVTFRQSMTCSPYAASFGKTVEEDSNRFSNQEQCSLVSSSTDSGYSHGQSVFESVSDYSRAAGRLSSRSHVSEMTDVSSAHRSTPTKACDNVHPGNTSSVKAASGPSAQEHVTQFRVTIHKNPGLGFSIAGGLGSHGNPYKKNDVGIFVTKVSHQGPAWNLLLPGDKILQVNEVNFQAIEHNQAVSVLTGSTSVHLLLERTQTANLV